jgi:hypothetical protein
MSEGAVAYAMIGALLGLATGWVVDAYRAVRDEHTHVALVPVLTTEDSATVAPSDTTDEVPEPQV